MINGNWVKISRPFRLYFSCKISLDITRRKVFSELIIRRALLWSEEQQHAKINRNNWMQLDISRHLKIGLSCIKLKMSETRDLTELDSVRFDWNELHLEHFDFTWPYPTPLGWNWLDWFRLDWTWSEYKDWTRLDYDLTKLDVSLQQRLEKRIADMTVNVLPLWILSSTSL